MIAQFVAQVRQYLLHPEAILLIIPAMIILWLLVRNDWVKYNANEATEKAIKRRKYTRWIVFLTRSLAIFCLLLAVASYYTEQEVLVDGDAFLRIVIDNSSSFSLYDQQQAVNLAEDISKVMRVETFYVGNDESTALGDAVLSSLSPDGNVLVVSDGQNNKGGDLGDVGLYAQRLNATVHMLEMQPINSDARVLIRGPSKTLADIENTFTVDIQRAGTIGPVNLVVKIDGQTVFNDVTSENQIKVSQAFSDGYHTVEAAIGVEDFFPQNNQYYKSVKVVPRPKIAYVTKESSPMQQLLSQVYDVSIFDTIPADLEPYHAVALNNLNTEDLSEQGVDRLVDFTADGNGVFVVGGKNSFERGGYKDSPLEQMLPVFVAEAGREEGDINVVLVIDISGSTGTAVAPGQSQAIHVNKAQAIAVYNDLRPENNLGVVAFNSQAFVIEPIGPIFEKIDLAGTIAKISSGGGTLITAGLKSAIDMLKRADGSKNIILISDGKTQLANTAFETTEIANKLGIKLYTVGVGARRNDFVMQKLAEAGNGIFFTADQSSKLKILFGDVEEGDKSTFGVTVLDEHHFITDGLDMQASVSGFNPVVPKSTANLLLTTDVGDPLLTVWRYGLGRVAVLSTDDGANFAGELLGRDNSVAMTRTLNWVIGDPDRKADSFIDVPDTSINEPTKITIKAQSTPTAQNIVFFKSGFDTYTATILPQEMGFQRMLDATFGVNYKDEFAQLGQNERLEEVVAGTGGKSYTADQLQQIIDDVTSRSKRSVVKKVFIRWPFIIAGMLLFLLDILLRRLYKTKTFKGY